MQVILSSTKSTAGSPYVYYEVSAEEVSGTRTVNSVQIKWGARARLANDDSVLGTGNNYGINGHLEINGTEVGNIVIKKSTVTWKGKSWRDYVYQTITLTGLSATQTAISNLTFNATRTSGSSSSAGYMSNKSCSDITITKGFQKSAFTSGATSGTLGAAQTIKISSVSDSFTHTLKLKINNTEVETILSNFTTSSLAKNISWTPSYNYASYNTTGNTISGQLVLTTSSSGVSDTTTSNITLTIPENSTTRSGLSIATSDTSGYLSTYGKYVQNKSVLKITPTFTAYKNSTAKSYSYTIKKTNSSGDTLATGSGSTFSWSPTYAGTLYIKVVLTDSRNFTTTVENTSVQTTTYAQPNISKFNCERNASTPSTIDCYFQASSTNVNSANANTTNYTLYYKKTSQSTYTSVSLTPGYSINYGTTPYQITGTDTASSYNIYLKAQDQFEAPTKSDTVASAFTLMNFNSNGKAMAIGKVSEATGNNSLFEVAMPTNITDNASISGVEFVNGKINKVGSIEVVHSTPYIDFHYDNNTGNYTSRIIENSWGKLTMEQVFEVTKALQIPVNGNQGYGLRNTAGTSIIRNWSNNDVALDATGNDLFLGYANTKKIQLDKITRFNQGYSGAQLNGGAGTSGYMYVGQLKIGEAYMNQPIIFEVLQRSRKGKIYIQFNGGNTTDPSLKEFTKEGNINAYIYKNTTSTWDLYIQKTEGYDSLDVIMFKGNYSNNITWTWKNTTASSLPTGYTTASYYYGNIVSLYDNSSGTSGNITLSETSANFTYLEIFYRYQYDTYTKFDYNSVRVFSPNGKTAMLIGSHDNGTYLYHETAKYSISGTALNRSSAARWRFATGGGNNTRTNTTSSDPSLQIVKVIGYR